MLSIPTAAPVFAIAMIDDEQKIFKELGARIAQLRKDAGLSQQAGGGKRGPTPVQQKRIERLNRLPKAQQKIVMQTLDGVLSQATW